MKEKKEKTLFEIFAKRKKEEFFNKGLFI